MLQYKHPISAGGTSMNGLGELLLRCILPGVYAFVGFQFARNALKRLIAYYRSERRAYQIIPGKIVEFEESYYLRKGHRRVQFYPIFEYQWKGKTRRKRARRVPARFNKDLHIVPATHWQVGDTVDIRIFPKKPSDARIEEAFYFFRSRTFVSVLTFLLGSLMGLAGIYWLVSYFL